MSNLETRGSLPVVEDPDSIDSICRHARELEHVEPALLHSAETLRDVEQVFHCNVELRLPQLAADQVELQALFEQIDKMQDLVLPVLHEDLTTLEDMLSCLGGCWR